MIFTHHDFNKKLENNIGTEFNSYSIHIKNQIVHNDNTIIIYIRIYRIFTI